MSDALNYQYELVGVFGLPVAENPTGVMQEAGFDALGLRWRYLTIDIAPGKLAEAIQALRVFNMQGVNLTIPYKVEVLQYLDEIAPDAPDIDYDTIHSQHLVCDVIPNPPRTPFLHHAAARGARTLDGLGMLVYQGAIAFEMWTGQPAPVEAMKDALEREFGVEANG